MSCSMAEYQGGYVKKQILRTNIVPLEIPPNSTTVRRGCFQSPVWRQGSREEGLARYLNPYNNRANVSGVH